MRKQHGITLLETILAIVVSGLMVVLAVRYYDAAHLNTEVTQASSQMNKIIQVSYEWLQGQRQADFEGSDNAIDIDKLVDAGLLTENDETDPWGGTITVAPGDDPNYVSITLPSTPEKACRSLSSQMENVAQNGDEPNRL